MKTNSSIETKLDARRKWWT